MNDCKFLTGGIRRLLAGLLAALFLGLSNGSFAATPTPGTTPPNIIIIMADDMGYSDIEPYGAEIKTPNLMKLAESGLRLTQFHNAAKCCPTRGSLMTGLYPQQTGRDINTKKAKKQNEKESEGEEGGGEEAVSLSKQAVTIAEVMKSAGYATYGLGKWHLTMHDNAREVSTEAERDCWPCQRGFDRFYGFLSGVSRYFNMTNLVIDNKAADAPAESYSTDLFASHASQFITEHAKNQPGKPFFMYLAFNAPHKMISAKEEDVAAYKGVYDIGWDEIRAQRLARQKVQGVVPAETILSPREEGIPAWSTLKPTQKAAYAKTMATYAGVITCMDRGIGTVISALESTHLRENTVIFFLSDNGACAEGKMMMKEGGRGGHSSGSIGPGWANVGNTPFRYWKNTTWEGGTATPLVVNWPQGLSTSLRGKINTQDLGHVIDFMPTCAELAKASYPTVFKENKITPMEGRSLVPLLQGQSLGARELFWQYGAYDSVRSGTWKMTRNGGGGAWMLFDLAKDPTELKDFSKVNPEIAKTLLEKWKGWATRVGANLEGGKSGKKER